MALTKNFRETIQARARRDPAFRKALLREAVECMLAGDIRTGKLVLRNYINATEGFGELAEIRESRTCSRFSDSFNETKAFDSN
jgi:hypothetical protein